MAEASRQPRRSENRENRLMKAFKLLMLPNAKLSYPERGLRLELALEE